MPSIHCLTLAWLLPFELLDPVQDFHPGGEPIRVAFHQQRISSLRGDSESAVTVQTHQQRCGAPDVSFVHLMRAPPHAKVWKKVRRRGKGPLLQPTD